MISGMLFTRLLLLDSLLAYMVSWISAGTPRVYQYHQPSSRKLVYQIFPVALLRRYILPEKRLR